MCKYSTCGISDGVSQANADTPNIEYRVRIRRDLDESIQAARVRVDRRGRLRRLPLRRIVEAALVGWLAQEREGGTP
jgi:hypothetical protein